MIDEQICTHEKLSTDSQTHIIHVLHCFTSYLNTSENWLFNLIKHQTSVYRWIASSIFIHRSFHTPDFNFLRSPIQPRLTSSNRPSGILRLRRAINTLCYQFFLYHKLRTRDIDIIHSHFAQTGWHYRKLAKHLRIPHIISFYGWDYVRMATVNPVWKRRLKKLYLKADCFLCEGPHGVELLVENGCPREKIKIAKLGVDVKNIPVYEREKSTNHLHLLQIASFREKKGHCDTLSAFAIALTCCPDMHLTLIGDSLGHIHDEVMRTLHEKDITTKVSLLPGIPFKQLHATMKNYDVFIHPSRHAHDGDCEGGAPIVLLDAQATGMPVISTTHCDIPQEVVHEKTGLLCQEGDVAALANAISTFYSMNTTRYRRYAAQARLHVERNFDVTKCATTTETIYRELVTRRARDTSHV